MVRQIAEGRLNTDVAGLTWCRAQRRIRGWPATAPMARPGCRTEAPAAAMDEVCDDRTGRHRWSRRSRDRPATPGRDARAARRYTSAATTRP